MKQIDRFLTTDELVEYVELKSKSVVYSYIKSGLIKPVNENKRRYRYHSSFLFRIEDAIKLKEYIYQQPSGLTTGEAAKFLGCSVSTIYKYIKTGILNAVTQEHKGKEIYLISKHELSEFAKNHKIKQNKKTFFLKEKGIFLYQTLINPKTNIKARIMELREEEGIVVTEEGDTFCISEIKQRGYVPRITPNLNVKYKTNKGYVKFVFPFPGFNELDLPVCDIIEALVYQIGPQNMRLNITQNQVKLEVKPTSLSYNKLENRDSLKWLERFIVSGEVYLDIKEIYLGSNFEPLTLNISKELKNQIMKEAIENNMTLEKYVISRIEDTLIK